MARAVLTPEGEGPRPQAALRNHLKSPLDGDDAEKVDAFRGGRSVAGTSRKAWRRTSARSSEGFTLIELLVVMILLGIMFGIAVPSWRAYQSSQQLISSTRDLVSMMRHAQGSAVANSSTTRVDFSADGKTITEYLATTTLASTTATYTQIARVDFPGDVTIASYSFTARTGGVSASLFFFSRGTATDGRVVLRRGTGATHTITVEGVTGRVSYS
jgi:type II secretion system protein H